MNSDTFTAIARWADNQGCDVAAMVELPGAMQDCDGAYLVLYYEGFVSCNYAVVSIHVDPNGLPETARAGHEVEPTDAMSPLPPRGHGEDVATYRIRCERIIADRKMTPATDKLWAIEQSIDDLNCGTRTWSDRETALLEMAALATEDSSC